MLDDIQAPNLYTLRGPRRVGKSTVLKQTIARLLHEGTDPRRVCYFAADSIESYRDLINVFQAARQLFPDLGDIPRYFLIDEVTSIRDWQRGVKWVRDNTAISGDCVVVTGSSAGDIAAGTSDLAGRRGPAVGLDRLLLPMSFPEFVRSAGYALPVLPRLSLGEFYEDGGRQNCYDSLVHLGILVDAFEAYLVVGGFPQAVSGIRRSAGVPPGLVRDLRDVEFLVLPSRRVVESKYIDTPDRRELRAMQANFGDGLLLTHGAVDFQAHGTIIPAALFCWLLDQA